MKKFSLMLMLIIGMAASTMSPLMACPCKQGNTCENGVWCCKPIGDGSAQSCTSDNECWFCVDNCLPSEEDPVCIQD